jgi:diacylglycerol kinase family enzyme
MYLIANPRATGVSPKRIATVARDLGKAWDLTLKVSRAPADAEALATAAARSGCDVITALGGDGTVNEVINGLGDRAVMFACLPGGRTNVFHRLVGMPVDLSTATRMLVDARLDHPCLRQVDVGVLNGRDFVASAGVGIDGSVARWASRSRSPVSGLTHWHYLTGAIRTFCRTYTQEPPRLVLNDREYTRLGISAFIQNGPHYTYFGRHAIDLASGGTLNDGRLVGALLRRGRVRDMPSILAHALASPHVVGHHPQVDTFSCSTPIVIRSEDGRPMPTAVDGEFAGEVGEAFISVRPRRLTVLMPRTQALRSQPVSPWSEFAMRQDTLTLPAFDTQELPIAL